MSQSLTFFLVSREDRLPKEGALAVRVRFVDQKIDRTIYDGQRLMELQVALPKASTLTLRKWMLIPRKLVALAKLHHISSYIVNIEEFELSHLELTSREVVEIFTWNALITHWEHNSYKTFSEEDAHPLKKIFFIGPERIRPGILCGEIIGEEVNACRRLANTPACDMTPAVLAQEVSNLFRNDNNVSVKIFDEKAMAKLQMNAILTVGKGSHHGPRFIVCEYKGGRPSASPIVLIGKGVTFDSGGYNLKPTDYIYKMHMDMSGAAAVAHALKACVRLKMKRNIVALIPSAENMVSGLAMRPGDIIKSMSGKTIEVLNTDAEGRLILADALTYAERYKPKMVMDVATLTGSAIISLGYRASAVFASDEKWFAPLRFAGEHAADYVWPMPLWEEYEEEIKGEFADVSNLGQYQGMGGTITAAAFLYQFAKKYPWIHIDMAPRMTSVSGDYLAKGAAGSPVRLLVKFIESQL